MELDQLLQTTSLDNDNSSVKYKRLGREINFYQGVSDGKKGGEGRECRNGNFVFHASSPHLHYNSQSKMAGRITTASLYR